MMLDHNVTVTRPAALGTGVDMEALETLFAGLSVLIGGITLLVGLLQLRWYWRSHASSVVVDAFELEATLPQVRRDHDRHRRLSNAGIGLGF
jgi:hypothetical protein